MSVIVYKQPNNPAAPGSGRFAEIIWHQSGDIAAGSAILATGLARGGAAQSNNFWQLSGAPVWALVQGMLLAKFGTTQKATGIVTIPGPFLDPLGQGGAIDSNTALEPIQQIVYESEVVAAAPGVVNPTAYGTAFYLNESVATFPTNGPGSGSARVGIGFGLNGTGWDAFSSAALSNPFVFAQPNVNAQSLNKLALQVIRPSAAQPGGVQWWVNDQKVASEPFNALPAISQGALCAFWFNGTLGSVGLGVRSARCILGPLDPSVYPF